MDSVKESEVSWIEEPSLTTGTPSLLQEPDGIGTIVIFVVSAILTITLLFVVAVFIDCRQEKLIKLHQQQKPKRLTKGFKLKIPKVGFGRAVKEDEETITDKMEDAAGPSTSSVIV